MKQIAILGAGGFGLSLAKYFGDLHQSVLVWSAVPAELEDVRAHGESTRLLPGVALPMEYIALTGREDCLQDYDIIIFAIASRWVRDVARKVAPFVRKDALLLNVGKGFEEGSLKRLSEVICEELPARSFVALSGPSHAEEIARGIPTTIVAASTDETAAMAAQELLASPTLRVYTNDDMVGVEYGGALKNVIALCAGISDGLGLGDNTKAALMTRGIAEIRRLGMAAGARHETFAGLAGIGDLIVTCTSMHSRNRRAGILIGKGKTAQEAIREVGMTVEGVTATDAAFHLAQKYHLTMPITEELFHVLHDEEDVKQSIGNLMQRPAKKERELLLDR